MATAEEYMKSTRRHTRRRFAEKIRPQVISGYFVIGGPLNGSQPLKRHLTRSDPLANRLLAHANLFGKRFLAANNRYSFFNTAHPIPSGKRARIQLKVYFFNYCKFI